MSIVRSLLVSVGFKIDKQSIRTSERAIGSFKVGLAGITAAATYAFAQVARFLSQISSAAIEADDLSRALGISLKEFSQLQRASAGFGLDEKEFSSALSSLNRLLLGFRQGTNSELSQIAYYTGLDITRAGITAKEMFVEILSYISTLRTESDKLRVAENIFGLGTQGSARLVDISKNLEGFESAILEAESFGDSVESSLPGLKEYNLAVRDLIQALKELAFELSAVILPAIRSLTSALRIVSRLSKILLDNFNAILNADFKTFKDRLVDAFDLASPLLLEVKNIPSIAGSIVEGIGRFAGDALKFILPDRLQNAALGFNSGLAGSPSMSSSLIVNNEINVPAGTSESQAQYIADQIQQTVDDSIYNTFRQIQYNNPMAE